MVEMIDFECLPAGPNQYAALKDARLTLKGVLWCIRLLGVEAWGFKRMQILGEDCTTGIYDMPDGEVFWDVRGEVSASGGDTSSCESKNSAAYGSGEGEVGDSDPEFDDEDDESDQCSRSDGSSSVDIDSLNRADGEFALLNVVGFVWFLVLRRCGEGEGDYTFRRLCPFIRYAGLNIQEQEMGDVRQITLV
ncbi:hypothetical protein J7T55_009277 [Diaporthe amygdali]|uniref:uncharacterized protein n=1 Tax=Phomopsis amygdali TaxID=1214568 RepID=UPI0022FE94CF|nr:uncharacterized protein J7T55_009277 [Diaporthe amygdali]KAJ0118494.1 hypothetical protein J7T55_009277 [Diaporthe amygdali]